MVTFLDIGLFQYFNVIFSILLVFAVVFALLHKTKILGENATISAIVAVSIALLCLLSQTVIDLINFMTPWFVLVFVFVILLLLVYQMLGATEKDILGALRKEKTIQYAVFGVAVVIMIAGFGHVWGEQLAQEAVESGEGDSFEENIYSILFDPKVLGLIFILLIAVFAIALLTS